MHRVLRAGLLLFAAACAGQPGPRPGALVDDGGGIGSKTRRTELRLQYSRNLSQRLTLKGAVRGGHEQRLGFDDSSRDRNYARSEVSMLWEFTPTLYVSGGYRYAWQKFKDQADKADNNTAFLVFGYKGLDIRRNAVRGRL